MSGTRTANCPLCGGPHLWREVPYRGTGASGMEIPDLQLGCAACGLWLDQERCSRWEQGKGTIDITAEARETLKAKWNRRA